MNLILYVPDDMIFDKVKLEAGAGKIEIESLKSNDLTLELGAGKVTINELIVLNKSKNRQVELVKQKYYQEK